MSLSHLYPCTMENLHIIRTTDVHHGFPGLPPSRAQFTSFRVLALLLQLRPPSGEAVSSFECLCFKCLTLAVEINSPIRVSRRAHSQFPFSKRTAKMPSPMQLQNFSLFVVKCFSSFVHTTCPLSVSHAYLAFDGVYHPFGQKSQSTLLLHFGTNAILFFKSGTRLILSLAEGHFHLRFPKNSDLSQKPQLALLLFWSNKPIRSRALLSSIASTERILVSSFSSA